MFLSSFLLGFQPFNYLYVTNEAVLIMSLLHVDRILLLSFEIIHAFTRYKLSMSAIYSMSISCVVVYFLLQIEYIITNTK